MPGPPQTQPPPLKAFQVSETAYTAVAWTDVAVSFVLLVARFVVQGRVLYKFDWDDALIFASWILLMTGTIIFTTKKDTMYYVNRVESGQIHQPSPDLPQMIIKINHMQWAGATIFYVGLWAIKFSFLVLFARLGRNVRKQKVIWWCAFAVTFSSLVVAIAISGWECLLTNSLEQLEGYCTSSSFARFARTAIGFTTGLDILTDLMIMSLPITLLWKVQVNIRRKLAIGGLFSLTFLTMAVSIARAVVVVNANGPPDGSLIGVWSHVEHTVAIIIACLVSYRAWFTRRSRPERISDEINERSLRKGSGYPGSGKSQPLSTMKTSATIDVYASRSLDPDVENANAAMYSSPPPPPPPPKAYF